MKKIVTILLIGFYVLINFSCTRNSIADFVIIGGKVATVDKSFSITEAVAIKGDKILFVGTNEEVRKYIGNGTTTIELNGELVLPGLIDSHGHLTGYGKSLEYIDLVGTTSYQEILDMVAEKVADAKLGEWIRGRGWDQNDWNDTAFPTHELLSEIAPNNPVVLTRIDGHALLVNQNAMDIAGINSSTKSPKGGKIYRNMDGYPTGVFIDNAELLITDKIPKYLQKDIRNIILNGAKQLTAYGITGIHDAGISIRRVEDYKFLIDNHELPIRINAMLGDTILNNIDQFLYQNKIESYGNDFLRVKSIKLYADGALGSRGAALFESYSDDIDNSGLIVTDSLHMLNVAKAALENDFQVCTHAIGDHGIQYTLNIYEDALNNNFKKDHRFRIEHSQIVNVNDIPRFKELEVIPAMQPQHAVSDMPWVEARIGSDRMNGAYAWHNFIDEGLIIPCGSDVPVEVPNPMIGIHDAVTRENAEGFPIGGWIPEQKMTIEEAIKGYTIWAAQAAFQEDILGSIETGKYADFTILDRDILAIDPSEILQTQVIYTIVNGKIEYQAEKKQTTF